CADRRSTCRPLRARRPALLESLPWSSGLPPPDEATRAPRADEAGPGVWGGRAERERSPEPQREDGARRLLGGSMDDPTPSTPPRPPPPPSRLFWIPFALVTALLFWLFTWGDRAASKRASGGPLDYSAFFTMVSEDKVARVTLRGREIGGELKEGNKPFSTVA